MTDKEKILAEINRRIKEIKELGDFGVTKVQVFKELLELQVFVDSLPSESASSVDMSLQEKKNLIASLQKDIIESIGKETMIYQGETYTRVYKDELDEYACKYPKSIPLPSKKFRRYSDIDLTIAIKAGAKWQKEQMMKNALISTIIEDLLYKSIVPTLQASIAEYKNGDKVKVIIVKEDEL